MSNACTCMAVEQGYAYCECECDYCEEYCLSPGPEFDDAEEDDDETL